MNFLSVASAVEKPCKDVLSYPLQCFQEMFLATPAVVGTFLLGIGGFAVAVLIWGAIFGLALFSIFFVLKHLYRGAKYFFTNTKVGQTIARLVPVAKYLEKFCCKVQEEVQPKRLINTQAIGDYSANIVSKVHVDTKWFKSAFKHVPFTKSASEASVSDNKAVRSPSKLTPAKVLAMSPKILSPKHKLQ